MLKTGYVGLISDRPDDLAFVNQVISMAPKNALTLEQLRTATEIDLFIKNHPVHVIFWDVDSPKAEEYMNPLNANKISAVLSQRGEPERVIALSDSPLYEVDTLHTIAPIGHFFIRTGTAPTIELCYRLLRGILAPDPFGLENYIPDRHRVQTVQIKESAHKRLATEAIHSVLGKMKLPSRLSALAAQCADELMVNAIFDAPRTFSQIGKKGTMQIQTRAGLDRTDNIDLSKREVVQLDFGITPQYLAIAVSDNFGGLKKQDIFLYLRKDFSKTGVKSTSTGVGVGGILQSGMSLLYIARPNHRTQAILFIPVVENFRSFRSAFRFFGFIQR